MQLVSHRELADLGLEAGDHFVPGVGWTPLQGGDAAVEEAGPPGREGNGDDQIPRLGVEVLALEKSDPASVFLLAEKRARSVERVFVVGRLIWNIFLRNHDGPGKCAENLRRKMTVVSRLQEDAAMQSRPWLRLSGRRVPALNQGKNVIDLAKRAGQRRSWATGTFELSELETVKGFKALLATWKPAGG